MASAAVWQVVGGAAKGGLVVRAGKDGSSQEVPGRLSTGSLVVEVEYDAHDERMLYKLVSGSGPVTGWVSTTFRGKELLSRTHDEVDVEGESVEEQEMDIELQADSVCDEMAMQLYCMKFGEADAEDGDLAGSLSVLPHKLLDDRSELSESEVCAELERDLSTEEPTSDAPEETDSDEASDSEMFLCRHCGLPIGQIAYTCEDKLGGFIHGECAAQLTLREVMKAEQKRQEERAAEKKSRHEEFEIGWKVEQIPRNMEAAAKLHCDIPHGMCCLVFDEASNSVNVAPTVEPAAAVNLEYLSTALEVRRRDHREPLFSLDPVDAGGEFFDPKQSMQVKRFEPAWLAGTSVGEVLFQSDYHLKELSMGEYEQPIVGMKSCYELSSDAGPEWSAREWFVVRKAEVQMSGDSVLLPCVKMGVEAREQIISDNGLEDVKTTKPNHPLVRYAEAFTHNFDLIAERKSVVYHLRELAKASVLAKFLIEADVNLDDSWFSIAEERATEACCLEIPQLWNDRFLPQIHTQDGKIVNSDSAHSLYGGVQFGLDKFSLAGARQPARLLSAGLAARQFVQPARHLSATLSAGLATRQFQRSFGPVGVQPARVSAGVGLDKFALAGARQPARLLSAGLAARQFVQPARHLSATLSAGLATRQFQRSFGPVGVQPARVSAGVGLDKFALTGARQPARLLSAGLAARQFVQPARHLSATLSAGLATRQFQRSFGPVGVQPARVSAGVGLDKFALTGARQPARLLSAGLAARQFVQPARHLSATLSAGLATRQFQRSFGPVGVQPARVSAGVGLDKFALTGARQPARLLSAGLAARQFVQPARHLSATLSAGLATRQFQRSFGPVGVQPARVSAGVGLDKFALTGARQPARLLSAGLAARQFVQPARHLSATLSAGLATRQFQRSFGPVGVQPARVSAGVGLDKFALTGARQPARLLSAGLAARQFVQPARHLSATLSAGLATRQFQRSFGPVGVQPARVSAGVGLDKFALTGARQPARLLSAGLAARQFVQPARHLSATLSAGLATRQFQRSFGPVGVQPARVSAGVGLDKFALTGARQPARLLSAGLAARQFVQPARHLSATLSAGLATRQFQRSFGPVGVQPARVSAGVGLDKFALTGARQPARLLSAGLAARQFVQPARHLSATLSAGLATRQFQRSFGPVGVQPARVSAGVGLDKFALTGARQPARLLSAGLAARQFVQPARHLSATLSAGLATRQFQRSFGPVGVQPARVAGVDLNLDEFNLSAPTEVERQDVHVLLGAGGDISCAFWSNLRDDAPSMFSEEDKVLLQRVFNPKLSDRREEGDRFVPPDTSFAYVQRLRALVKEEEAVQERRREQFLSKEFTVTQPGPLFPPAWVSPGELAAKHCGGLLHARSDYLTKASVNMLKQALSTTDADFDQTSEDGCRFRIYKLASLEVRTTQAHDGEEVIGAVFSTCSPNEASMRKQRIQLSEKIVKATEYVERLGKGYQRYVVLETEHKHAIMAEEEEDKTVKHLENPADLERRNAFAKVVRTADSFDDLTVGSIKDCQKNIFNHVFRDLADHAFMTK